MHSRSSRVALLALTVAAFTPIAVSGVDAVASTPDGTRVTASAPDGTRVTSADPLDRDV